MFLVIFCKMRLRNLSRKKGTGKSRDVSERVTIIIDLTQGILDGKSVENQPIKWFRNSSRIDEVTMVRRGFSTWKTDGVFRHHRMEGPGNRSRTREAWTGNKGCAETRINESLGKPAYSHPGMGTAVIFTGRPKSQSTPVPLPRRRERKRSNPPGNLLTKPNF